MFKRLYPETIVTVSTTDVVTTFDFSLSELPGSTDFTNLYRQFKLNALKITVIPNYSVNMAIYNGAGVDYYGRQSRVFVANSRDEIFSTAAGATIDTVRQLQGCKIKSSQRMFSHICYKPAFNGVISSTADTTTTLFTRPAYGWMDTEATGFKY